MPEVLLQSKAVLCVWFSPCSVKTALRAAVYALVSVAVDMSVVVLPPVAPTSVFKEKQHKNVHMNASASPP